MLLLYHYIIISYHIISYQYIIVNHCINLTPINYRHDNDNAGDPVILEVRLDSMYIIIDTLTGILKGEPKKHLKHIDIIIKSQKKHRWHNTKA